MCLAMWVSTGFEKTDGDAAASCIRDTQALELEATETPDDDDELSAQHVGYSNVVSDT
jgi:hypothetical protein